MSRRFDEFGIPLVVERSVIPRDETTLFVCSGMQNHKERFREPDGSKLGSLQSCVRTKDLELVGDGTHLSFFEMLGNFSFGGGDYEESVELWDLILRDLGIPVSHVTHHPSQSRHRRLWVERGYEARPDPSCEWSDGVVGGFCSEVFVGELEIGNLVNPLGHSTDVGFGLERLVQVVEGEQHVQGTTLFRRDLPPVVSDHLRTLEVMRDSGVRPGPRGRGYVCRRLLQRVLPLLEDPGDLPTVEDWLREEEGLQRERVRRGRRHWKKFKDRSEEFWKDTFGLSSEDLEALRGS